jgi:hypothetical protein
LKKEEVKKELQKAERDGVLNIQMLVVRSSPHSSSSLECEGGKTYNENVQFV